MGKMSTPAPPNWYRDPHNPQQLRWWSGTEWTAQTHPLPPSAPPAPAVSPAAHPPTPLPPAAVAYPPAPLPPAAAAHPPAHDALTVRADSLGASVIVDSDAWRHDPRWADVPATSNGVPDFLVTARRGSMIAAVITALLGVTLVFLGPQALLIGVLLILFTPILAAVSLSIFRPPRGHTGDVRAQDLMSGRGE